jgi:hypothetical protein
MDEAAVQHRVATMKKKLIAAVLSIGIAIPSAALAATGLGQSGDLFGPECWCPWCRG